MKAVMPAMRSPRSVSTSITCAAYRPPSSFHM
jgi:hypothetical protein